VVVNGWRMFTHPLFAQQLEKLVAQVEALAAKDPATYKDQPATKLLATIRRHILEIIPRDPNALEFRQGNTLGEDNRHWFRAKFHERYRLFYRFSSRDKVIIYAWVNDENSLRKAGAKTDPYTLFRKLLAAGNPPSSISQLLGASKEIPEARGEEPRKLSLCEGEKTKRQLPRRKK
jgi:toxin YhaV